MTYFVRIPTFFSRTAIIDNYVFRIHYRVTFIILVVFACIVGWEIYFREAIKCGSDEANSNCWMQSTYTILEHWDKKVGDEVPHPGVGSGYKKTRIYHHNYHRVLLALCLQALFFYLPRYFWKRMEGGKLNDFIAVLRCPFTSEAEKKLKKQFIVEYLTSNKNNHLFYFAFYALAEFMNFVNVLAQVIFMDTFLGGNFSGKVLKYGKDIWFLPGRSDALLRVFPRYTKCEYFKYGSSGDVWKEYPTCQLILNPMNEKIYVFLWIWCIFLIILSFSAVTYRVLTAIAPKFRSTITFLRVRITHIYHLEMIVNRCGLGDWLILDFLAKNLDPLIFRDIIDDLAERLGYKRKKRNYNTTQESSLYPSVKLPVNTVSTTFL